MYIQIFDEESFPQPLSNIEDWSQQPRQRSVSAGSGAGLGSSQQGLGVPQLDSQPTNSNGQHRVQNLQNVAKQPSALLTPKTSFSAGLGSAAAAGAETAGPGESIVVF